VSRTSSVLIVVVLLLVSLGIVMLASTSNVKASAAYRDPYYFLKRQLVWLAAAAATAVAASRFDYHRWQQLALPLAVVSVVLLALVLVPYVGVRVGGSRRWLRVWRLSFQPSELGKLAVAVGLSAWVAHMGRRIRALRDGLLGPLGALAVVLALLLLEPDFGTTLLTGLLGLLILFAGGARLSHLAVTGALGAAGFVLAVMHDPVRMGRILAFLMPEKYPATAYHLAQSKLAFIRGQLFGVGLGNSLQKQFYLPEAHTDFILAIIGEELGLLATGGVLLLFLALLACGLVISRRAPDPFGRLLSFALVMMVTLQAAINIGVVTGCLPTKGIALPFISYGGSSLVVTLAAVGILLNVSRHGEGDLVDEHTRPIKDRAHRL
jgi:cell division protein FtsW